ncbi:50S ribosomal protein L16 [Parcubacteria bacterium DG_74_2]|nr:MAG: 50S ribosomal protein L16 [Parcubacteria bacterium DG_74_2]
MSLLIPKKVKYRKMRKGRSKGIASRATELAFGSFGLKALEAKWISSRQIEAARRAILRYLRKGGKLWIRIFPQKPVTKKSSGAEMGGGKGDVSHYVFPTKPGRILFEIEGIDEETAQKALRLASDKLPLKTKFIKK